MILFALTIGVTVLGLGWLAMDACRCLVLRVCREVGERRR